MVAIIGAGPAGSYLAFLLAKTGQSVDLYEEHAEIGIPIQCSGVITQEIESLIPLKKEIIVNKIKKVRFHAPDNSSFEVKIKEDYVFNRQLLDQHVASLAEQAGAKIYLNHRFHAFERKEKTLKINVGDKVIETDVLIGADGPHSAVAKAAGLYGERTFMTGIQAQANADIQDKHIVEIFLGYGSFGWLIPENEETGRIGVVGYGDCKSAFDKLMALKNATFLCHQSGLIPLYTSKIKTEDRGVFLIGDAACQVKGSTHGGILYGMLAAKDLATTLLEGGSYEKRWKKRLGLDLWLNLKIHQTLERFSEKELNRLVALFSQEKLKNILSSNVRDFPSKFLLQLLLKEPRLLQFSLKGIQTF